MVVILLIILPTGNITCALTANSMDNNTLFILVSDNGGSSDMDGNNYPYRGGAYTFHIRSDLYS